MENTTQFGWKFHPVFSSERILKIGYYLRKLLSKVWWLSFLEHAVYAHAYVFCCVKAAKI